MKSGKLVTMDRRVLYHSLRISWKNDPSVNIKTWQVDDYRELSIEQLCQRLSKYNLDLDRNSFTALSDQFSSPEEMSDEIVESEDPEIHDQVYLLLFELWRRLVPEKQTLSLFCDELDVQIDRYDSQNTVTTQDIEDALNNLLVLLEENADKKTNLKKLFSSISEGCAHDLEGFIYDYISNLIDHSNVDYAKELVEGFKPYFNDSKWINFLEAQIMSQSDASQYFSLMKDLIKKEEELPFLLEVFAYLSIHEDLPLFTSLAKKLLPKIKKEDEFQDFLASCEEFHHHNQNVEAEKRFADLINKRANRDSEQIVTAEDQKLLLKLF